MSGNVSTSEFLVNRAARGMQRKRSPCGGSAKRAELRKWMLVNKITMHPGAPWCATHDQFWRHQEMRFYGIALLASAAVLGACGGEKAATDTAAAHAAAASATPPAGTYPA